MGVAYSIVLFEIIGLTKEQAQTLLDSGLSLYKNERQYLQKKAEGVPFNKIKFPRYMTDEMAVVKAGIEKRKMKDWEKWQIGGE